MEHDSGRACLFMDFTTEDLDCVEPDLASPEPFDGNQSCDPLTSGEPSEAHRGHVYLPTLQASEGFVEAKKPTASSFQKKNWIWTF